MFWLRKTGGSERVLWGAGSLIWGRMEKRGDGGLRKMWERGHGSDGKDLLLTLKGVYHVGGLGLRRHY